MSSVCLRRPHISRSLAVVSPPAAGEPSPLPVPTGWRLAVAGGLAGMITNTLLHPLDTVKTLRQSDPTAFRGVFPTLFTLVQTRGPTALYAGILPALVGSALSSALYFSAYESAKRHLHVSDRTSRLRVPLTALSAACGNVASSILFVPKEVVKQRMQSAVDGSHFFTVASNLVRLHGPRGLYRGYKATLLRNIPSTMIRFAVYEELKAVVRKARKRQGINSNDAELVFIGAAAGVIASTITTPMDVIKTRFATGKLPIGTSLPQAARTIVSEHGVAGLFIGVKPRILWSAVFAGVGFSTYEMCKSWMATGQLQLPGTLRNRSDGEVTKSGKTALR